MLHEIWVRKHKRASQATSPHFPTVLNIFCTPHRDLFAKVAKKGKDILQSMDTDGEREETGNASTEKSHNGNNLQSAMMKRDSNQHGIKNVHVLILVSPAILPPLLCLSLLQGMSDFCHGNQAPDT